MSKRGVSILIATCLVVSALTSAVAVGAAEDAGDSTASDGTAFGGCAPVTSVERTHDGAAALTNESAVRSVGAGDYPPGVSASGVTNASVLVAAHKKWASRVGFAAEFNATFTSDRQPEASGKDGKRYVVAPNRSRFAVVHRDVRGNVSSHVWGNASTVYGSNPAEVLPDNRTLYSAGPTDRAGYPTVTERVHRGVEAIEVDLRNADFNVTDVMERDGRRLFVLRSGRISYDLGEGEDWSEWEYDATLVADSAGRVHYFHAYRHATASDDNRTFREEFRLCRLGGVTASAPAWVAEVPPEAHRDVRLFPNDRDQRYLVLTNEGTDPVPANAVFAFRRDETTYRLGLDAPLAPNGTVYAYFADGGFHFTDRESVARRKGECLGPYIYLKAYTETGASLSGGGGTTTQCEPPETRD